MAPSVRSTVFCEELTNVDHRAIFEQLTAENPSHTRVLRTLEIGCGTQTGSKAAELYNAGRIRITSVDTKVWDKSRPPTHVCDIHELPYKKLWQPGDFDCVKVTLNCKDYSNLGKRDEEAMAEYDQTMQCAIDIIAYLQPRWKMFENPARGQLHKRLVMQDQPRPVTTSGCQYGKLCRKDTHIFTNIPFQPKKCPGRLKCKVVLKGPLDGLHPVRIGGQLSKKRSGGKADGQRYISKMSKKIALPLKLHRDLDNAMLAHL